MAQNQKMVRVLNHDGTVSELPAAPPLGQPMQPQGQPGQPMSFSQQRQQPVKRTEISWDPPTNSKNEVELSDGTFLIGIPDTVMNEPDASSRVVLALLGEVLTQRARVDQLEQQLAAIPRQPAPPPPGQMGDRVPELSGDARQFREAVQASGQHVPASEGVRDAEAAFAAGLTEGSQTPQGSE